MRISTKEAWFKFEIFLGQSWKTIKVCVTQKNISFLLLLLATITLLRSFIVNFGNYLFVIVVVVVFFLLNPFSSLFYCCCWWWWCLVGSLGVERLWKIFVVDIFLSSCFIKHQRFILIWGLCLEKQNKPKNRCFN